MKKEDVPQDDSFLAKSTVRDLYYATDKEGKYTTVSSQGWEAKDIALQNSLQYIEERVQTAKEGVLRGDVSPIVYYMELNKMDPSILASYMESWKWKVKRHFKPAVFKKLSTKTLNKYASIFNITVEELLYFKKKNMQ